MNIFPRYFHIVDRNGSVLWSSESIPRSILPIFIYTVICTKCRTPQPDWPSQKYCILCGNPLSPSNISVISRELSEERERIERGYPRNLPREQIDDWVLGVAKDHIVVRKGKLVTHWAIMDPYGYGMQALSLRIFNVYTGQMLRVIKNCIRSTIIHDKIVYLRSLHPSRPFSNQVQPSPTEIVIEDVIEGELLSVGGDSCFPVKDCFIIRNGNEILAYHEHTRTRC